MSNKGDMPIFPLTGLIDITGEVLKEGSDGLTLRQWYAGQYDASLVTINDKAIVEKLMGRPAPEDPLEMLDYAFAATALLAFRYADALLEAEK